MEYYIITFLIFVTIIGILGSISKIYNIKSIIVDITNYKNDFIKLNNKFIKTGKVNNKLFDKMSKSSSIISKLTYKYLILPEFISKVNNTKYTNYNMVCNFIPNYRIYNISNQFHVEEIKSLSNVFDSQLSACVGYYENEIKKLKKQIRNPYYSLKYGYRIILIEFNSIFKSKGLEDNLDFISNLLSITSSVLAILQIIK